MATSAEIETLSKKVDVLTNTVNRLSLQLSDYVIQQNEKGDYLDDDEELAVGYGKDENKKRGNWSSGIEFVLATIGAAVGLGNIWRFPYLVYKHGGAVFLIPYCIMLVFVGMPVFFLEVSLGQYTSEGSFTCWQMATLFRGTGFAQVFLCSLLAIYYNVVLAWAFFYLFDGFRETLLYETCDHSYNTEWCSAKLSDFADAIECQNNNYIVGDDGVCYDTDYTPLGFYNGNLTDANGISKSSATEEYFVRRVLKFYKADGVEDLGEMQWKMVLCLLLAWAIVFLSVIKSVKSVGKVVWVTAIAPYILLIIFFAYGLTLDGAEDGIEYYLTEIDWDVLKDANVWKDAAVQIFFSLSAGWGMLIVYSSYNRFHTDIARDTMIIALANSLTSFFAGFVVFSYLGFLAHELDTTVDKVATGGPGLVFIVYPAAIAELPTPPLWNFLFFLMLILLGLDSEYSLVEAISTPFFDTSPTLKKHSVLTTLFICIFLFCCGLSMCTDGGYYMLVLLDYYTGGWNVLITALMECIVIAWVYGAHRFRQDINIMLGGVGCHCFPWSHCSVWWILCWAFLTPLGLFFTMVFSWVEYQPLEDAGYVYPDWANALGWLMLVFVLLCLIVNAFYVIIAAEGTIVDRIKAVTRYTRFWGPALPKHRKLANHLPYIDIDPWNNPEQKFPPRGQVNETFYMNNRHSDYNNYKL